MYALKRENNLPLVFGEEDERFVNTTNCKAPYEIQAITLQRKKNQNRYNYQIFKKKKKVKVAISNEKQNGPFNFGLQLLIVAGKGDINCIDLIHCEVVLIESYLNL